MKYEWNRNKMNKIRIKYGKLFDKVIFTWLVRLANMNFLLCVTYYGEILKYVRLK